MTNKNTCVTKFVITVGFKSNLITKALKILPSKKWDKGDIRADGKQYPFSYWATPRLRQV